MNATTPLPNEDEVFEYYRRLSNWGRWGDDDELGTLNFITPAQVVAAARLIKEGIRVSCGWEIDTNTHADQTFGPPQRFMIISGQGHHDPDASHSAESLGQGAKEYFGMVFHGIGETHVDALCHRFWNKQMYNGYPAERVNTLKGAMQNAITACTTGITGRGVLLDVPRARGMPWMEPGTGARAADLDVAEKQQNVRVTEGDIVLLRTGTGRRRHEHGRQSIGGRARESAGWAADCMPWLHERKVAAIGCDTAQEILPSPYAKMRAPVHTIGIVSMGLWLLDNCDLEELSTTCEKLGRWEFHFSMLPLRIQGGTGSPVNPIATF